MPPIEVDAEQPNIPDKAALDRFDSPGQNAREIAQSLVVARVWKAKRRAAGIGIGRDIMVELAGLAINLEA